jgi:hypothetical protein
LSLILLTIIDSRDDMFFLPWRWWQQVIPKHGTHILTCMTLHLSLLIISSCLAFNPTLNIEAVPHYTGSHPPYLLLLYICLLCLFCLKRANLRQAFAHVTYTTTGYPLSVSIRLHRQWTVCVFSPNLHVKRLYRKRNCVPKYKPLSRWSVQVASLQLKW